MHASQLFYCSYDDREAFYSSFCHHSDREVSLLVKAKNSSRSFLSLQSTFVKDIRGGGEGVIMPCFHCRAESGWEGNYI
jgi:hypothetical protein